MEEVDSLGSSPFNGSLETGMRAVMALHASFPMELDIQRLTALDYLIVRTSLLDGPDDLHPSTPITTPVTQVRRKAVYDALDLMMSRELVERTITSQGIYFRAGEYSSFFVEALTTKYAQQLLHRDRGRDRGAACLGRRRDAEGERRAVPGRDARSGPGRRGGR